MSWKDVQSQIDKITWQEATAGGLAVVAVLAVTYFTWKSLKGKDASVKVGYLINIGTLMATAVQTSGMFRFFGDVLHLSLAYKIFMFPFMEVLLLAFGIQARSKARAGENWLVYAFMLWVLALSSGGMSASDASGFREGLFRLLVAVIVALLWSLELWNEWQKARKEKAAAEGREPERVRWRMSPRSIAIRLGLAAADDSSLADLDANRHLERFLRISHKREALQAHNPEAGGLRRLKTREAKADARLQRHARLHADPSALMDQLGAQAIADAQTRLGLAQAQAEVRAARDAETKSAAEVERLNKAMESEREAAAVKHAEEVAQLKEAMRAEREAAASKSTAEVERLNELLKNDRSGLGKELAEVRQKGEELARRFEELQDTHRRTAADLQAERQKTAAADYREELRERALKEAQDRAAALESKLDEMRAALPAAGLPAQRVAAASVSAPRTIEAKISNGSDTTKKADYFKAADERTGDGANVAHPLLNGDSRVRNAAAQEVFEALGFPADTPMDKQTIRKYSRQYRETRLRGDASMGDASVGDVDDEELTLIDN